jgi:hypothetical protein
VLSWDGPSRFCPPPLVPPVPDGLAEEYPAWELFGGIQCNAVRRDPYGTPQEQRPGVFDSVVAKNWDALRERLEQQVEAEARMGQ